jgi:pimeloyl-ACP methyl ester carboxylesterase
MPAMSTKPTQSLLVAALSAAFLFGLAQTAGADASVQARAPKATVVLVHGAWADGTGWQHVIPRLEAQGFAVTAVQNPLTSLTDDVATTRRALAAITGPIILVAHSYGGVVITEAAAGNAQVVALVFVAAFAPDVGESLFSVSAAFPAPLGDAIVPDAAGFLFIDRTKFRDVFAADVPFVQARVMAAAQHAPNAAAFAGTVTSAAWKTIPSFYLLTRDDQAIDPELQRFMADRAHAQTREIDSSHAVFVSHPGAVTELIDAAARATVK